MSTENRRRRYRQTTRARQQEETRLRITEALVELHRTIGPAKTTISDLAEHAGVGRMTVYKHFPTEGEMFQACGQHWSAQHPSPDFTSCLDSDCCADRARCVFRKLYRYYRETHDMMGKILRDAPLMPALQQVLEQGWHPLMRELEALLLQDVDRGNRSRLAATARVALDMHNWETLIAAGLSDRQAADLAAGWLFPEDK